MIFPTDFLEDVRRELDYGDDLTWQRHAACEDMDQALFYLETGGSSQPAREICATCPVKANCAADALRRNDMWGIWGGTTPEDRRELKRALGFTFPSGHRRSDACKWGHPWTQENTIVDARGHRRCAVCQREKRWAS